MIAGDLLYTRRNKVKKELYVEVLLEGEYYFGYLKKQK